MKFLQRTKVNYFYSSRHRSVGRAFACGDIGPIITPKLCLLAGMWKRSAELTCWPPRGQQCVNLRERVKRTPPPSQ